MTSTTKGFTLVEILISIAILGIVSTAILSMTVQNLRSTARVNQQQAASNVARKYMEDVKNLWLTSASYKAASLPTLPSSSNSSLPPGVTCTSTVAPNTNITTLTTTPTFRSRIVTLTCTGNGNSQNFSLEIVEP